MADRTRVAILGATGYGGGELLRLLLRHPNATVAFATSRTKAGTPVAAIHRNLAGLTDLAFSSPGNEELLAGADVIIGALPHGASAEQLEPFVRAGKRVIDLSGDFRLRDAAAYKRWYKHDHPFPDLLGAAVYGAPELHRDAIRGAKFVASPGCFATAINLALLPLAKAGLLTGSTSIVGMTGSSGSGADPGEGTHHPTRAQTLRAYKVLDHQHTPEVLQFLGDAGSAPSRFEFIPVSAPIVRGILLLALADTTRTVDSKELSGMFAASFSGHPFIKLIADREPECAAIAGTNYVEVRCRPAGQNRVQVSCALDNLVKGGAGQAVHSLNLMMGFAETAGLDWAGTWP